MEEIRIQALEFRKASPEFQKPIEDFFRDIEESGMGKFFHPHPFTKAEAQRVSYYEGKDLYYVAVIGGHVLGYGFLRGWDDGYTIPSLGILLHSSAQGQGLGRTFMYFLHAAARQRGAAKIMLKVYPDNIPAVNLYTSLGYVFQIEKKQNQLVGILELG